MAGDSGALGTHTGCFILLLKRIPMQVLHLPLTFLIAKQKHSIGIGGLSTEGERVSVADWENEIVPRPRLEGLRVPNIGRMLWAGPGVSSLAVHAAPD